MINRLRNLFNSETRSGGALSSPELAALFGAISTATGASVTPETAMRCAAVFACVKVISEAVAQLPLILYRRSAEGRKDRETEHPLFELLHDAPNEWTSSFEFRLSMQTAALLHGNAFAFVNRDGARIAEMVQIPSSAVTVEIDRLTGEPSYQVAQADGTKRHLDRTEVLHVRGLGPDGVQGLSPVMQAREAIGLAMAMEQHAARLFSKGARPSGVLRTASKLSPEAQTRLAATFEAAMAGAERAGKTLVLEDGMEWQSLTLNSVDLQFLELRRNQVAEIARVFRVPLHMLQDLERTTHANAESLGRQFLTLTLMPWLKAWEGAIRRTLLSADERREMFAEFLTDDLARADTDARYSAYATAVTNGILSPNEVRAAENRSPYEGGDAFRLPLNTEDAAGAARSRSARVSVVA